MLIHQCIYEKELYIFLIFFLFLLYFSCITLSASVKALIFLKTINWQNYCNPDDCSRQISLFKSVIIDDMTKMWAKIILLGLSLVFLKSKFLVTFKSL